LYCSATLSTPGQQVEETTHFVPKLFASVVDAVDTFIYIHMTSTINKELQLSMLQFNALWLVVHTQYAQNYGI
jgi:hypothetical protein